MKESDIDLPSFYRRFVKNPGQRISRAKMESSLSEYFNFAVEVIPREEALSIQAAPTASAMHIAKRDTLI